MLLLDKRWYFWGVVTMIVGIVSLIPLTANADALKVVVQDENGSAIPSATVTIGAEEQTTDDDGAATFSDVTGAQSVQVIGYRFC